MVKMAHLISSIIWDTETFLIFHTVLSMLGIPMIDLNQNFWPADLNSMKHYLDGSRAADNCL